MNPFNDFAIFDISMALVIPVICIAFTLIAVIFNASQPCEPKIVDPQAHDQKRKMLVKKKSVDTVEMFVHLDIEDAIGLAKTR